MVQVKKGIVLCVSDQQQSKSTVHARNAVRNAALLTRRARSAVRSCPSAFPECPGCRELRELRERLLLREHPERLPHRAHRRHRALLPPPAPRNAPKGVCRSGRRRLLSPTLPGNRVPAGCKSYAGGRSLFPHGASPPMRTHVICGSAVSFGLMPGSLFVFPALYPAGCFIGKKHPFYAAFPFRNGLFHIGNAVATLLVYTALRQV